MRRPLNIRQERFCEFIADGESQTDAYLKAGFKVDKGVARRNAARLMTNADIAARIAELRKPVTKKLLLSKDRKRELLRDIAEDPDRPPMVRIRAIEIDAKLAGHFEADRVEVDSGSFNLDAVRERMRAIVSPMVRTVPRD
jgi:phage terminase small subunit